MQLARCSWWRKWVRCRMLRPCRRRRLACSSLCILGQRMKLVQSRLGLGLVESRLGLVQSMLGLGLVESRLGLGLVESRLGLVESRLGRRSRNCHAYPLPAPARLQCRP